jgi:hypothetical protein
MQTSTHSQPGLTIAAVCLCLAALLAHFTPVPADARLGLFSRPALPPIANTGADRVVKDGAILARHADSRQSWTRLDGAAVLTAYAGDGRTALYTALYPDGANDPAAPAYRQTDTLFVADWSGHSDGSQVIPYGGEARRIEDLFAAQQGLLWVDGVGYRVSDGVFKSLEGLRAWVAVRPRPLQAAPTAMHVVLFERAGQIYYGGLQKAGTRIHLS